MKTKPKTKSLLPTEKTTPCENLGDYLTLIYGREKIGKTTIAAEFPDALFIGFEPGTKALEVYRTDIERWDELLKLAKELRATDRFETLIIDTIDLAYVMCENQVCSDNGWESPSDGEWGAGWKAVKEAFRDAMLALERTGRGIVLLSHEATEEYERPNGKTVTRIVPSLAKTGRKVIEPMLDIWVYYGFNHEGKREMVVRGDDLVSAGTRTKGRFAGINSVDAGNSAEDAYTNFVNAFNTKNESTN